MSILKKLYRKIGIHTAPPGTVMYYFNRGVSLVYNRILDAPGPSPALLPIVVGANLDTAPNLDTVPHWYKIVLPQARRPSPSGASPLHFREILQHGEHVVFDLDLAINHDGARGLALVFFMGMGDYLFATPFIAEIRQRYPKIPIYAYVSSTVDSNNSPLVGKLMEHNKDIDKIFYYRGVKDKRFELNWKNYGYDEVYGLVPADFLVVPVVYEYAGYVRHRVYTLFDTFRLPRPETLPRPIFHLPESPSENTRTLVADVAKRYVDKKCDRIVFLHLDMRSTSYSYPYADELAERLEELGCLVVSFSAMKRKSDRCILIDISKTSIAESIYVLKMVQELFPEAISMITSCSVFWSVSAGLNIKNLGIHHFYEECIHSVWYDNTSIITRYRYPGIPAEKIFVASESDVTVNEHGFDNISPEFVMRCMFQHLAINRPERAA